VVVEEVGSLASSDGLLLAAVLDGGEMQMELCCLPVLEELLPVWRSSGLRSSLRGIVIASWAWQAHARTTKWVPSQAAT
jgi:hypothetical protein